MTRPLMSLVVLSFNRFEVTTGPCLASLLAAQPMAAQAEVILVDNGSSDGATTACEAIAAQHPELIRWVPLPENLGFAGGMNRGGAQARGEWLILVNSDTLLPEGALEAFAETLAQVPVGVGLVGPVTNAAGNGQCLALPQFDSVDAIAAVGAQAMQHRLGVLSPTYRCDFFCVAIRRTTWEALGGLDECFGLGYYEDFDFSLRARQAGFESCITEDVFIVHAGSISFKALGAQQHDLMKRNKALLQARHPDARFEHQRLGNAQALDALMQHAEQHGWSAPLQRRASWRYAELCRNEPRSPLKRWLWRRQQSLLKRRLDDAGIVPEFPTSTP